MAKYDYRGNELRGVLISNLYGHPAAGARWAKTRDSWILDLEKMSLGALADGFAVKVKGDTFKRSGIPNSRFEILQQGFVPDAHGGGHCEMQVSEPVMLIT